MLSPHPQQPFSIFRFAPHSRGHRLQGLVESIDHLTFLLSDHYNCLNNLLYAHKAGYQELHSHQQQQYRGGNVHSRGAFGQLAQDQNRDAQD
jgi:hypothetical protein